MSAIAWEIVVGIETHAQLLTRSKIFSGASTAFGAEPNTQASAVDIALPGVLPVLNAQAVELAVRFGIAVGANINRKSIFARKNYFYPDLPKGYQISQYEIPVVQGGSLKIVLPGGEKTIRLTRAHLEEDAGKSLHEDFQGMTGIDLNRAGTPLLEIVTEPELRGAKEAIAYAQKLHALLVEYQICDGNMQEGSFRCDANVSVRRLGDTKLGTRCEIKNLNSFRFMEQAIEYEARRQIEVLEAGGTIEQQTRLYDPDRNETRSMRTKEDAQDYRYFPDPDLLPLVITEEDIERIRSEMPEPLELKRQSFVQLGLSQYQADLLTSSREWANVSSVVFTDLKKIAIPTAANFLLGPLSARLNQENLSISQNKIPPHQLKAVAERIADGTISSTAAAQVILPLLWAGEGTADEIIEKKGLRQISDVGAIEKIVDEVLAANVKQVEDYRAGREKAFNSLVGQVMKRTQGKANPAQVNEILRRKLAG
jgi:aspartyl-tRNA(Asn)/glutamyl-tRNA(Gln) amidotransferase subunit B